MIIIIIVITINIISIIIIINNVTIIIITWCYRNRFGAVEPNPSEPEQFRTGRTEPVKILLSLLLLSLLYNILSVYVW
jgi:hypothetical protein